MADQDFPTYEQIRAELAEYNPEAVMLEDPAYETALVGWTHDYRAVYDMQRCVQHLVDHCQMSFEEADEFFSYNTLRALDYIRADERPVMVHLPEPRAAQKNDD